MRAKDKKDFRCMFGFKWFVTCPLEIRNGTGEIGVAFCADLRSKIQHQHPHQAVPKGLLFGIEKYVNNFKMQCKRNANSVLYSTLSSFEKYSFQKNIAFEYSPCVNLLSRLSCQLISNNPYRNHQQKYKNKISCPMMHFWNCVKCSPATAKKHAFPGHQNKTSLPQSNHRYLLILVLTRLFTLVRQRI